MNGESNPLNERKKECEPEFRFFELHIFNIEKRIEIDFYERNEAKKIH